MGKVIKEMTEAEYDRWVLRMIEKHGLDEGRECPGPFREFVCLDTPELRADLEYVDHDYRCDVADNEGHPDCGKSLVIFSMCLSPEVFEAARAIVRAGK